MGTGRCGERFGKYQNVFEIWFGDTRALISHYASEEVKINHKMKFTLYFTHDFAMLVVYP